MSERRCLLGDSDQEFAPQEEDCTVDIRNKGTIQSESVVAEVLPITTEESEKKQDEVIVQTDPKRWYLLGLFSSLGFTQGMVWNTWGPISGSTEFVFNWQNSTIATLSNWGPIAYILVAFVFAWLMDVKGLRLATLLSMVPVALGTGIRCLMVVTSNTTIITWLMHIGQLLNGIGGPVAMGGPPVFSSVWFPVHQRTTATAISASVNGLGVTAAYIIEFAACALALILMLIYFPSKPKISPSITASQGRIDFKKGAADLIRNKRVWLLAMVYSISGGVYGAWGSILDVVLKPHHINETTAGWIGFWAGIASQVSGLLAGFFADMFAKKMKLFVTVMYSVATIVILVLALECTGIIPISIASVYALVIIAGISYTGTIPLFFELSCETSYPVAEGLTNTWMTWWNNVFGLIFLLIPLIPNIGTVWMNWCLAGSFAVCVPAVLFYKEGYTRYDIDVEPETHAS